MSLQALGWTQFKSFSVLGLSLLPEMHSAIYILSTAISPGGPIVALRFVFRLCQLPPLVNNHTRLLFMRSTIYDRVILDIWPFTLWYAGPYSTPEVV